MLKESGREGMYKQGLNALCVYALASAERAIRDPRLNPKGPQMDAMLEKLKGFDFFGEGRGNAPVTYSRGLRLRWRRSTARRTVSSSRTTSIG